MTILVTGASGVLGRYVVDALVARGVPARGTGRSSAPHGMAADWRRADLLSGDGLADATAGLGAVIHCASDVGNPANDEQSLANLIEAARREGAFFVYASIAGIADAAEVLPYYRAKLACEQRLADSGLPHTVCRATQFHPFVGHILTRIGWGPFQLCPPMRLQPVDPRFYAERLVDHALAGDRGKVADVHGPESLDTDALLAPWLRKRSSRRVRLPCPALGPLAAFRRLRPAQGDAGGVTWSAWVAGSAASPSPYDRTRS